MIYRFKQNQKEARVHFIPDLKDRVFVTLRTPEVIKRIVSDEDNAIIEAVKTVFPEVSHSFCVYHQLKNVSKKYSEESKPGDEIPIEDEIVYNEICHCLLYTSPSPRD